MESCPDKPHKPSALVRVVFAALGVLMVGIGTVGVFLPGLPTTGFLILACWLFARSCPWLERKLIRENKLFAPFLRYLEPGVPMPLKARIIALVLMWIAVTISVVTLIQSPAIAPVWPVLVLCAAVIGSLVIVRFRSGSAVQATADAPRIVVLAKHPMEAAILVECKESTKELQTSAA